MDYPDPDPDPHPAEVGHGGAISLICRGACQHVAVGGDQSFYNTMEAKTTMGSFSLQVGSFSPLCVRWSLSGAIRSIHPSITRRPFRKCAEVCCHLTALTGCRHRTESMSCHICTFHMCVCGAVLWDPVWPFAMQMKYHQFFLPGRWWLVVSFPLTYCTV